MFDQFMQSLIAVLFVLLVLAAVFFTFVLWTARESILKLVQAIRVVWKKAMNDNFTRDEMIRSIRHNESRGNTKAAAHWRSELVRKYPNDRYVP